jgi:hypothetical protein
MSKIRGVFPPLACRRARLTRKNKPRRRSCPPLRLDSSYHGCARFGPGRARFGQILPESRPYRPALMRPRPSANPAEGDASQRSCAAPVPPPLEASGRLTELSKSVFIQPLFYHNRISCSNETLLHHRRARGATGGNRGNGVASLSCLCVLLFKTAAELSVAPLRPSRVFGASLAADRPESGRY